LITADEEVELARSAFHQSANYRSVVIFSHAKVVKNRKKL